MKSGLRCFRRKRSTRESRSNTLALTIKAYELAPLCLSLSLSSFRIPSSRSFSRLPSEYVSWIHKHRIQQTLKQITISLCAGFREDVLENRRHRLNF